MLWGLGLILDQVFKVLTLYTDTAGLILDPVFRVLTL